MVNFSSYANIGEWVDEGGLSPFTDSRVKLELNTLLYHKYAQWFQIGQNRVSVRTHGTWHAAAGGGNLEKGLALPSKSEMTLPYDPAV